MSYLDINNVNSKKMERGKCYLPAQRLFSVYNLDHRPYRITRSYVGRQQEKETIRPNLLGILKVKKRFHDFAPKPQLSGDGTCSKTPGFPTLPIWTSTLVAA